MKKIIILSLLTTTLSFAGRIVDANNSSSSSSESASEESSEDEMSEEDEDESDDEIDYDVFDDDRIDEPTIDFRGVLHEMADALQPRSFFRGEMLLPLPDQPQVEQSRKRGPDDTDERPTKRKRVQTEDPTPDQLRTPIPEIGGVLGALLGFGTPTWEEPFFGALETLDILSLGAVNQQANRRIPNNLVLNIHYHADLDRLLALPLRAAAFGHLVEINFDIADADDDDDARIIAFLDENASALVNLRHLTFEPADCLLPLRDHIFSAAVRSEGLRQLLQQTEFIIELTVDEEELNEFFELLTAAQRLGLNNLLDLRVYDDERDLHRWFLERFPRGVAIYGLHFQGATFGDYTMGFLGDRFRRGYFPDLRVLTFNETGLEIEGYEILGGIIRNSWLTGLERLVINNEDVEDGLGDDDALGALFDRFPEQARLDTLLPHLVELNFYINLGGFISDSAIHNFAAVIGSGGFPALRTLRLRGDLTDSHIETLIHIAPRLHRLRTLDFRANPNITLPLILRLQEALPRCKILSDLA